MTAIDAFKANVAAYVALHHQVERYLSPQHNYVDAEESLAYAAALRRGIVRAAAHRQRGRRVRPGGR